MADDFKAQINAAISAHGMWKTRLYNAMTLKTADVTVADAQRDDRCKLGQWFHGLEAERSQPQFEVVRALHARFHAEAGRILALALAGQAKEARAAMDPGTEYDRVSTQLTDALNRWGKGA
jgi:methyl-accepting chemotaxis protein